MSQLQRPKTQPQPDRLYELDHRADTSGTYGTKESLDRKQTMKGGYGTKNALDAGTLRICYGSD